jgi:hypothetical protein
MALGRSERAIAAAITLLSAHRAAPSGLERSMADDDELMQPPDSGRRTYSLNDIMQPDGGRRTYSLDDIMQPVDARLFWQETPTVKPQREARPFWEASEPVDAQQFFAEEPQPESQLESAWRAFKRGVVPTLAAVGTGALTGAGVGAALGEVAPGPGTVIGGIGGRDRWRLSRRTSPGGGGAGRASGRQCARVPMDDMAGGTGSGLGAVRARQGRPDRRPGADRRHLRRR